MLRKQPWWGLGAWWCSRPGPLAPFDSGQFLPAAPWAWMPLVQGLPHTWALQGLAWLAGWCPGRQWAEALDRLGLGCQCQLGASPAWWDG